MIETTSYRTKIKLPGMSMSILPAILKQISSSSADDSERSERAGHPLKRTSICQAVDAATHVGWHQGKLKLATTRLLELLLVHSLTKFYRK
jgi:hypothetical protein